MTEILGVMAPPELVAIHTNMPSTVPPEIYQALRDGTVRPPACRTRNAAPSSGSISSSPRARLRQPDGPAAADAVRDRRFAGRPRRLVPRPRHLELRDDRAGVRRREEGLSRDDVLDNITITWLTNTAISGARLYWEALPRTSAGFGIERNNVHFFEPFGVKVPIAVTQFPDELYPVPKSWAERAYPKLIHYGQRPKGGHFAAFEQPDYLVEECARRSGRCAD